MKMRKVLLLAMLPSLLFFACSDDDVVKGKFDGKPVRFNSGIQGQTRASGTQWDQADAIGIYMKTSGGELSTTSAQAENKKHTTVGDQGEFVYASPQDAIYFPADGSNVDFLAYYPYQETIIDFKYPVNVSGNQTGKFPDIDLMYSNNETGKNNNADDVSLQFVHKLATVYLDVADKGGKSLAGMTVTVKGMKTKSSFSLVTGTFTDDDASVNDIIAETKATNSRAIVQAIVLPVEALSGAKISFNIPSHGKTFEWDIPANQKYESGNKYSYEVEVKADGGLVVLNPSSNITGWTDNDEGKIELGGDEDPTGDGTQSNPYILSQLETKVGETGKWVEGYIVGSTTKTRAIGTPSTENILLATTATETNEANCIPVDISSSTVKANLDIVANPDLIGKKIKIQGDIVNNIFGNTLSMANIIAQEGGADPGTGEPEEFFKETFGNWPSETLPSSTKIASYTNPGFDMTAKGITYTDPYEGKWADVRTTKTLLPTNNMHVWLPAYSSNKESGFLIEGIDGGYKNVTLSYEIAANLNSGQSIDVNTLVVKCNDSPITIPSKMLTVTNTFEKISVTIPDGTTKIEFYSGSVNDKGLRLDNIILEGTK